MYKLASIAFAIAIAATPVLAQTPPPTQSSDAILYRQLLDNANAQMVQSVASLQDQIKHLQDQYVALQKTDTDKDAQIKKLSDDAAGLRNQLSDAQKKAAQ